MTPQISVLSTEPWVLMGRGHCCQFPSVDGVGAMASDSHVGTCPQKGTRAGSNAVLPPDTFTSFFFELVPQSYFAMSLAQ